MVEGKNTTTASYKNIYWWGFYLIRTNIKKHMNTQNLLD
jgi:hypothetical protein